MRQHVTIAGALFIVYHAMIVLFGVFFFVAVGGALLSSNPRSMIVAAPAMTILAMLFVLIGLPGLIAGFGLLKFRSWARVLAIIVAAANLLAFPFGTVVGIYVLWVLLNSATQRLFAR